MDYRLIKYMYRSRYTAYFFLLLMVFIFFPRTVNTQSFVHLRGSFKYNSTTFFPILHQEKSFDETEYKSSAFSYPVFNGKFKITGIFGNFWGLTYFNADDGEVTIGSGSGRTKINRYGLQLSWNMMTWKNRIKFGPYIRLDYESSNVQVEGVSYGSTYTVENNKNYQGQVYVEPFAGGQILPSLGLSLSIRLFWKISFIGDMFWSFGHRTYQRMWFDYSYKGVPQPRAEWHTKGSGFVKTLGIGIQIWDGNKKKNRKRK